MPHYDLYFDGAPGGPWMGQALAEPGCTWLAPDFDAALADAPAASSYGAWASSAASTASMSAGVVLGLSSTARSQRRPPSAVRER